MTVLAVRVSMNLGDLWALAAVCIIGGAAIALLGVAAYNTRRRS